jgi:amino acid adenylation domain-containing protein
VFQQLGLMEEQLRLLRHQAGLNGTGYVSTAIDTATAAPAPPAVVDAKPSSTNAQTLPTGFGPANTAAAGVPPELTARQQEHLKELIQRYNQKTNGSKERTQKYRHCLADPRTAAGFNRRWKELVYPIWVERSKGSRLWDVDGNEYIDLLNGFGPTLLGHSPDYVVEAIRKQLESGIEVGPQTPLIGEVCEMICKLTGMERVSFTCTGSEAVQAAMRLSRTVTGRDKVVVFSKDYHGNFDQVLVRAANKPGQIRTVPSAPGIPEASVVDTYTLEYGTDESLELIEKHADEIAAVLVEPVQSRRPDFQPREFVRKLRALTREKGIVFVFDEVITGFRTGPDGAQGFYGIEADLATYGKIVAGGMPIGVVAGKAWVMDTFDGGVWQYGDESFPQAGVTFFAGTFVRHPLTIAAAHAALTHLVKEGPDLQRRVADRATRLASRVNEIFRRYMVDIEIAQFSSQMYLRIKEQNELSNLIYFHLRYRGIHILEGFPFYMSDAHTEEDIDRIVGAFAGSVDEMVKADIFGRRTEPEADSAADTEAALSGPGAVPEPDGQHDYAVTDAQREMWVAAQINPDASAASNACNVIELSGELDLTVLRQAVSRIVSRHPALWATFSPDGTTAEPFPPAKPQVRSDDLSDLSGSEQQSKVDAILAAESGQVFDLAKGPLASFRSIRLATDRHLIVFTAQMIACDGWGFKVVLEELASVYTALIDGRSDDLPAANGMRQFARWLEKEKDSEWYEASAKKWLDQFNVAPIPLDLPSRQARSRTRTFHADRVTVRLDKKAYDRVKNRARELRSTPFSILLSAYQVWLHRLSGVADFVVAVPFAAQPPLGLNRLVGQCVQTLPFRVVLEGGDSFADCLLRTRGQILSAQEYWGTTLADIARKLELPADRSRPVLASVMFNFDPPANALRFGNCSSFTRSGPRINFHYELGFNIVDEGETLAVECDYNRDLFAAEIVQHWVDSFTVLLASLIERPQERIGDIPMLPPSELGRRDELNATMRSFPPEETVHGLFEKQASRTPDAVAVQHGAFAVTYSELESRSNRLANYLAAEGIGNGSIVGVCLNRSIDMVVALAAILKTGAAYVPLDPDWPKDRKGAILRDTRPAVLLAHEGLLSNMPETPDTLILCLDTESTALSIQSPAFARPGAEAPEIAYVLYTSGSTGQPKGVEVYHSAIVNFLISMAREPGIQPTDAILALTTLSFDISVLEIFLPLTVGGRVVIGSKELLMDPVLLDQTITKFGITAMQATPTAWNILFASGWTGRRELKVLCGGEAMTGKLAEQLTAGCGEVWNMYGPTETTVWSTVCRIVSGELVSIGHPIDNTQVYIVDTRLQLLPAGIPGELLIGGAGMARRYRNLPEHTADRFVPNPFDPTGKSRLYRTGDLARFRGDGDIELLGRADSQIKLRGHRIELGEIESVILGHPAIAESAAVVRTDGTGDPLLTAFVSTNLGEGKDAESLANELRELARGQLPTYMVPSEFIVLERLPKTSSGKVDRRALLGLPFSTGDAGGDEFVAPRDEIETRLSRLWCECLRIQKVSVHSNFFDLGGQSLLALGLFTKIEKEFGRKLPLAALLTASTIADMADRLRRGAESPSWRSLVPIQPRGSKPPLFLVHGAGGNVLLYRGIADHLAPDYPLYGLQSEGLDGESEPLRTIEEMAIRYLDQIRSVQPRGPYFLGGYCLGGTVAYEMARMLRAEGEEVPLVAMLDTYNFSRALKVSFRSFLVQKFLFHAGNFVSLKPRDMMKYVREKTRLAVGGELANLKTATPSLNQSDGAARADSGAELSVQAINDKAVEDYVPAPYEGELALFKPRFNYKFYPDPKMGWGDLALGGLDIVEVAVNPHSMLLEPHVKVVAEQLKIRMDRSFSKKPGESQSDLERTSDVYVQSA